MRNKFAQARRCLLAIMLALPSAIGHAQTTASSPQPAVPIDPVTGIIDAFKTYRIVALGEGDHGNEQSHAVRLALIRDPRFANAANDIDQCCAKRRR